MARWGQALEHNYELDLETLREKQKVKNVSQE
jgi:hypothetical protein